jgi:hypothetical protein
MVNKCTYYLFEGVEECSVLRRVNDMLIVSSVIFHEGDYLVSIICAATLFIFCCFLP